MALDLMEWQSENWECQAYGPGAEAVGARCFFAVPDTRLCATQEECRSRLAGERVRVFERIHDLAASGDPVGQYLANEFTDPDQLLGGEPPVTAGVEDPVPQGHDRLTGTDGDPRDPRNWMDLAAATLERLRIDPLDPHTWNRLGVVAAGGQAAAEQHKPT